MTHLCSHLLEKLPILVFLTHLSTRLESLSCFTQVIYNISRNLRNGTQGKSQRRLSVWTGYGVWIFFFKSLNLGWLLPRIEWDQDNLSAVIWIYFLWDFILNKEQVNGKLKKWELILNLALQYLAPWQILFLIKYPSIFYFLYLSLAFKPPFPELFSRCPFLVLVTFLYMHNLACPREREWG